jgi:CubicO group peptidase (beta-lactamase class C family)
VPHLQRPRHIALVVAVLAALATTAAIQRQTRPREPASKAAAILFWSVEQREKYIVALDNFFLTRTVRTGSRIHALEQGRPLSAYASEGPRADALRQLMVEHQVRGVLVLHDGRIRLERYLSPATASTRWNSFSIAKSITSTLVGVALKDGSIQSLDDPVTSYIDGLRGSAYDVVTVRQLLSMTSGVRWNEDYADPGSDVAQMYARTPADGLGMTVSYVRTLPREAPAGTKWVYKTSETNLVGLLVSKATGRPLADYLSEKIWSAYGMERDAEWMVDDVGDEQGGCCLAMTLRDLGRFGQFILDGARINGQAIVADTWLAEATRDQVPPSADGNYGYQWWPRDDGTVEGRGIYGQLLHIDRARNLVIVLNSATVEPTSRASSEARQKFISAVKAELDAER